ncbi:O-antigen ligase family protein [Candidatus Parcubacteria bacterium]|nr:O-antigen ligase family protein [Candidatus Parcubacteria bacterium]
MQKIYRLPYYGALALLIYMPFHIFLSQWLSTFTGGLNAWKVGKDVLLILAVGLTIALVYYKSRFKNKHFWIIVALSVLYTSTHLIVWVMNPEIPDGPALLGTVYNSRLFGYLILGYGAVLLIDKKINLRTVFKILIAITTIVSLVGLAQWFLPKDIMTHFGYSLERGVKPAFFIDENPDFFRVISTIRDPNSLGTFLIMPITLLSYALVKFWRSGKRILISGLLLLHLLVLFLTFSRSALGGVILSVGLMFALTYRHNLVKWALQYKYFLAAGLVALSLFVFAMRDQYIVQNIIFHSDENTSVAQDSNEQHISRVAEGTKAVIENPAGYGPGTAGWVSLHNKENQTENYFVQIAYETGIIGLVILMAMLIFVAKSLWDLSPSPYVHLLLAVLAGIILVNMVSHIWINEAVDIQWWLLAGLVLAKGQKRPDLV